MPRSKQADTDASESTPPPAIVRVVLGQFTATSRRRDPLGKPLSVYLDLVRFSAAVIVFLSHACKPGFAESLLPNLVQNGIDAVTIFFVLSGFVISYTAVNKDHHFYDYIISRIARLWSVGIPAILLSAILFHFGRLSSATLYDNSVASDLFGDAFIKDIVTEHPVARAIIGVAFLNEAWNLRIIPFGNAPYWSISYEFCYYLLFGALFYFDTYKKLLLFCLIALVFGPKILILFPIWLMGSALYRWRPHVPPSLAAPCMAGPLAVYLLTYHYEFWKFTWRFDQIFPFPLSWSSHYLWQYFIGVLVAIHLVGFDSLRNSQIILRWERPIRSLASVTLSIYLFHFPIIYFLAAVLPSDWPAPLHGAAIIATTVPAIYALSLVTEARKTEWQKALRLVGRLLRIAAPIDTSKTNES
jgi:peptidoglycan/LPS O-acetylase OafA/YrhL